MQDYSYLLYNDIKRIVKDVIQAQNPTDTIGGVVVSTDPLSIVRDNQHDPIPKSLVKVPSAYSEREYDVEIEVSEGTAEVIGSETPCHVDLAGKTIKGKMRFDNSLEVGDWVQMIKGRDGQEFIVIGKN